MNTTTVSRPTAAVPQGMEPFDLQKALANPELVVMRNGQPVKDLRWEAELGLLESDLLGEDWTEDGRYWGGSRLIPSHFDLFIKTV